MTQRLLYLRQSRPGDPAFIVFRQTGAAAIDQVISMELTVINSCVGWIVRENQENCATDPQNTCQNIVIYACIRPLNIQLT